MQRQLGIEPLSEACHRALIRLHYLAGDLARRAARLSARAGIIGLRRAARPPGPASVSPAPPL